MKTYIVKINSDDYNSKSLKKCANILLNDGIGAFPTETVYGLGGNGLSPTAVKKIYSAKGRPSDNPLILHISNLKMLNSIVTDINENSKKLIDTFWPGPLTLIFKKSEIVPYETSGGLNTIAVRFPKNKIAQQLIEETGKPIAAPSANTSGKPSPTRFSHVEYDLFGKVDFIIDGGNSTYGLESTIVDCTNSIPIILRPGSITKKMIEEVIGNTNFDINLFHNKDIEKPISPGMKYKHYSPEAEVILIKSKDAVTSIKNLITQNSNKKIGILCNEKNISKYEEKNCVLQVLNESSLYHTLRKFDFLNVDIVYTEYLDENDENIALMNRLKKSANYNIIEL